jgi:hypothetical protein
MKGLILFVLSNVTFLILLFIKSSVYQIVRYAHVHQIFYLSDTPIFIRYFVHRIRHVYIYQIHLSSSDIMDFMIVIVHLCREKLQLSVSNMTTWVTYLIILFGSRILDLMNFFVFDRDPDSWRATNHPNA